MNLASAVSANAYELVKYGAGTLNITAAQTAQLGTNTGIIVHAGKVSFSGAGILSTATKAYALRPGSVLEVLDNGATPLNNRLGAAANIDFKGGALNIVGNANGTTLETLATPTFGRGFSVITVTAQAGQQANLVFSAAAGAQANAQNATTGPTAPSVLFRGTSLGTAAGAGIATIKDSAGFSFNGQTGATGATTKGLLPWALIDASATGQGTSFATGDAAAASATTAILRPLAAGEYSAANTIAANNNVLLTTGTTAAAANVAPNSLTIEGNAGLSLNAGVALNLSSGGILVRAGSVSTLSGGLFNQTSGFSPLNVWTVGDLTISAPINGGNGVSNAAMVLIKAGAGTLTLAPTGTSLNGLAATGRNTLNGQHVLNGGTLKLGTGLVNVVAPNNYFALNGGTLDLNGNSQMVYGFFSDSVVAGAPGVVTSSAGTGHLLINNDNSARNFAGSIQGATKLTRSGLSNLSFYSDSTYTGATVINGGNILLRDGGALSATSAIAISYGAGLYMENASSANNANNRVNDAAPVTLRGGIVELRGRAQTATTEALGAVTLAEGASFINSVLGGTGINSADLSFGGLTRSANATVNFTASTAGLAGSSARIQFSSIGGTSTATTGGGLANGIIGGWATIGTSDFATYVPGLGIAPLGAAGAPAYASATTVTGLAQATDNIKLGTGASSVANDLTINSLATSNVAVGTVTIAAGKTLTLASGGLLSFTATSWNLGASVNQGFLTSGGSELFFYVQTGNTTTPTVNAVIKDGASALTLVKSGANTGTLAATNTYTGGTVVNQGTLNVAATGLIPLAADPTTGVRLNGGNLTAFAAGAIAAGNTVILNGSGSLYYFDNNTVAGLKFNNLGGTPTVRTFATNSSTGLGSRGVLTIGAGGIVATSENVTTTSYVEGRVDFGASANTIDVAPINVNGVTDVDPLRAGFALQAVVGSAGGLTKTGNGVLQLNAQSHFTGGLTIAAGGLRNGVTNAGSRLSRLTLAAGSRYDLYNLNTTWGSLAGSGDIFSSIASPNLQVGFDGTSSTFSGRIQRFNNALNPTLTKVGGGVLTLDAAQDGDASIGQIVVGGGTLRYAGAGKAFVGTALLTTSLVANTNGTLQLDNTGTNVANRLGLAAAGNLYVQGGKFVLGGNAGAATSETLANLNVQNGGGRIELTPDAAQALTLAVTTLSTANGHGTLVVGGLTAAASAAGVANLTITTANLISGQGTGANGTTTMGLRHDILADASVSGLGTGFLVKDSVTNNYRALASSELNTAVATWATTQNAGLSSAQAIKASSTANSLTIGGAATLASGLDATVYGKFSPAGALLTQSMSGAAATLVLAGATGNINVGAFQSATVGTTPFIHVVDGGTLNVNAAFAVGGTAGMVKADGGVLSLNGQAYFTGTAVVNGGTLSLNSGAANTLLVTQTASGSGMTLTNLTINGSSAVVDLKNNAQVVAALTSTNPLPGAGGTVTNSGGSVVVFTDSTQGAGATFAGQLTGNLAFTKSGANTQVLTGASTYVGETIVRGGTLQLRDGGTLASTAGLKLYYGTLNWDNFGLNAAASATPTRVAAANAVTLLGGSFTINGGGSSDTNVTLNAVTAQAGSNSISTLPYVNMGSTVTLTIGDLVRGASSHAGVNFIGYTTNNSSGANTLGGQGLTTNSNIFLTKVNGAAFSSSGLSNNLIGGWAVADGSTFATYNNTFGVVQMGMTYGSFTSADFTGTDITSTVATGNYNYAGSGTTALTPTLTTGAKAANSWRIAQTGAATTVTLVAGTTLSFGVGIITNAGQAVTIGAVDSSNTLSGTGTDLYFFANQNTLAIQPKITGAAAVVVNGGATVSLRPQFASNDYAGGTYVNAGTLNLQAATGFVAIPGDLIINNGAVTLSTTTGQVAASANLFINGGGSFTLPNYASAATQTLASLTFTNDGGAANPTFSFGTPTALSTIILSSANPITAVNDSYSTTPLLTGSSAGINGTLQFSNATPTITVNAGLGATGLILSALISDNAGMTGALIKAGAGTLALTSAESTFTKGVNLTAGSLMIGAASTGTAPTVTKGPLGTGTLTVGAGTTLLADGTARSLANALSVGGDFTFGGLVAGHSLTLTGATDLGAAGRTITVTNPLVTATLGGAVTSTATGTALTKAGAGVLVLSSAANNFNSAGVSITGGILKYGVAGAIPTTSAITIAGGAGLDLNGFDFNPQTQSLTGAGFVTNSAASTSTLLVAGTSATDVTTTGDTTFGVALADNNALNAASKLAVTKGGLGTLTFTNTTSVNAGPVLVVAGTVNGAGTNTFSPNATIQLGNASTATAATPTATLDVLSFDQTIGGLATGTNTAGSSAIVRIGTGRTLTTTATNTLGANVSATDVSKVFFTDGGTLVANGATFQVGGATGGTNASTLTVDMTALAGFTVNAGAAGIFRLGELTSGTNGGTATMILSPANTINANLIGLGDISNGTAVQTLKLGAGTNVLNANTITIGGAPVSGNRGSGVLVFNGGTGSVKVRSLTDAVNGRANLNMAFLGGATGSSITANFDVTGHSADLRFDVMQLAQRTGTAAGAATATFAFDTGTLDANDLLLGYKSTTGNSSTATMTLGGAGVSTFNSATNALRIGVNAGTTSTASGTLNVSGGTVTVAGNAGTAIRLGDASAAGGTASGTLNLTGGTLTVTGDVVRGATAGTSTAVLTLDGATLDLSGNDIGGNGSATGNLTTTTFASGTLKNVGQINNGAGLTKTGTGTLTLTGASSYTGVTTVSAGKLAVSSFGDGVSAGALGLAGLAPANLVLATGTTLGYVGAGETSARGFTMASGATLEAAGTGALTLSSAAKIAFANSTATRSLTLDGTSVAANSFGADLSVGGTLDADKIDLLVKDGVGTWIIANGTTLKGTATLDVNAGLLGLSAGVLPASGSVVLATGTTLRFESGNTEDLSGRIHLDNGASATLAFASDVTFASSLTVDGASAANVTKTGAGKLTLSAANATVGSFTVAQGTVNVTHAQGLGAGATTVNGGLLAVNAVTANAVTVNNGGTVGGAGTVATLTIGAGAKLSPGNSPGTLTAGNAALLGGSIFEWQVQDVNNVAKYDHFDVTGTLDLSGASSSNRIVFKVVSLLGAGDGTTLGNPLNFDAAFGAAPADQRIKTFNLGIVGSVNLGANANINDVFSFDVSQFTYSDGSASSAGLWSISWDAGNHLVTVTAVPEPSTYGFGLGALALAAAAIRRRRKTQETKA